MSLTPKQEKAALKYVECSDKSEAYRHAYNTENMKPESVHRAAHELFDNPKVASRVQELLEEHRARHRVTVDSITEELEEARTLAINIEQPSSAVTASMGKAKIHGLITDKSEHTGKDGNPLIPEMPDMELARRLAFGILMADKDKKKQD